VSDPVVVLLLTVLAFLLAGIVKGVIGLGLPTVAIGVLSVVMQPSEAAALLVVPSLVTNIWQLAAGPGLAALARRLWTMLAGIGVGTWAGAGLLTGSGSLALLALGLALLTYGVIGLFNVRFVVPSSAEPWLSPLIGTASGLVTAATGVFVLPGVPYLQALGLSKDDLVQALGLFFTVSTVALAAALAQAGAFNAAMAGGSALAVVAALLGMALGQRLRAHVSEAMFRRCFFAGMLALGLHLAARALF
jgi:uncharacterized membrane protein YfcA